MTEFIKEQQELARNTITYHITQEDTPLLTPNVINTLITQIITNTGEELMRRANEEKDPSPIDDTWDAYNQAIDTLKKHIANVTGVE